MRKSLIMRINQLKNIRKKIFIFIFVILVIVTILNHDNQKTLKSLTNKTGKISDEDTVIWNEEEWFQIKREYDTLLIDVQNENSENTTIPLKLCNNIPSGLKKRIKIFKYPSNFNATTSDIFTYNRGNYRQTSTGHWETKDCQSRHRVAIIIPYKNRVDNLNYFLTHMHPFLQRQELSYQIFVVEQYNNQLFNKGVLMNAGFLEIMNLNSNMTSFKNLTFPFDCVIFHDVDLLPEDDRIMYSCPFYKPRHLSVAIDKYKYRMAYYRLIGGVLNFKASHFIKVNGYSNQYWGWGAEDDDMEVRLSKTKLGFERPNINIAHYSMLKHKARFKNPRRRKLLIEAPKRYTNDGINSVDYKLVSSINYQLFTHVLIDVGKPPQYIIDILNPPPKNKTIIAQLNDLKTGTHKNLSFKMNITNPVITKTQHINKSKI